MISKSLLTGAFSVLLEYGQVDVSKAIKLRLDVQRKTPWTDSPLFRHRKPLKGREQEAKDYSHRLTTPSFAKRVLSLTYTGGTVCMVSDLFC